MKISIFWILLCASTGTFAQEKLSLSAPEKQALITLADVNIDKSVPQFLNSEWFTFFSALKLSEKEGFQNIQSFAPFFSVVRKDDQYHFWMLHLKKIPTQNSIYALSELAFLRYLYIDNDINLIPNQILQMPNLRYLNVGDGEPSSKTLDRLHALGWENEEGTVWLRKSNSFVD